MNPITCATCRHFQPDPLNPEAGMGRCLHPARHGYWHAKAEHRCVDHEATPHGEVACVGTFHGLPIYAESRFDG